MGISIIAAMANNRVIGNKNQLPWQMPADLAHFKQITMGKPIIMGRKTFESIGRPLPGRQNIILTRQEGFKVEGCNVVHSLESALALAKADQTEVMIIGGSQLFETALPLANKLYLTLIDADIVGDTYFPTWNKEDWQESTKTENTPDEKNQFPYTFITLERSR